MTGFCHRWVGITALITASGLVANGVSARSTLDVIESRHRKTFWQNVIKKSIRPASTVDLNNGRRLADAGDDAWGNNDDQQGNVNNYYYDYDEEGQEYGYNAEDYNDEQYQKNWYREEVNWGNVGFDVTQYSLKYIGCSAIKTYSDDKAEYGSNTVLSTNRFALFRLCPSDTCSTWRRNGCVRNFGEYVLEMDAFLDGIVQYNRMNYWYQCKYCTRCNALESFGQAREKLIDKQKSYYKSMLAYFKKKAQNNNYQNQNAQQNYYYNGGDDDQAAAADDDANRKLNDGGNNKYYWNGNYYDFEIDEDEFADAYGAFDVDEQMGYMWQDDWDEDWLNYEWRNLPYCSKSDLNKCSDAESICQKSYDNAENDQNQKSINAFSSCIQVQKGYYVAPHCGSDGYTIKLGVYSDDTCDTYLDRLTVADLIGTEIESVFEFFPEDCVSCQQKKEEAIFNNFLSSYEGGDGDGDNNNNNNNNNGDYDFDAWMDEQFDTYLEYLQEYYEDKNNNRNGNNYYNNNYRNNNNNDDNDDGNKNNGYYSYNLNYNYYAANGDYRSNNQGGQYGYYYDRDPLYFDGEDYGEAVGFYTYSYQLQAMENNENNNYYTYAENQVSDLCGILYEYSAKCNKNLKNNNGNDNFADSYTSDQRLEDEDLVCIFAENLRNHKYSESGEVNLWGTLELSKVNWMDKKDVGQIYHRAGFDPWHIAGVIITFGACVGMALYASCIHKKLIRMNIPWRPKRGRYGNPTDIETQDSGILSGRSTKKKGTLI